MNSKLGRYYRSALSKISWLILLLGAAVNLAIRWSSEQFGADALVVDLLGSLLSLGVIAGLFLFAEKQVRSRLWKLAYPELDLAGEWSGVTRYEQRLIPESADKSDAFEPFERSNVVLLKQDCLGISVVATVAPPKKGRWYSLASSLEDLDVATSVNYAYYVDYAGAAGFPNHAIGYETLSVIERTARGKARKLSGSFSHCARGQSPVYSGSVAFSRVDEEAPPTKWGRVCLFLAIKFAEFGKPKVE